MMMKSLLRSFCFVIAVVFTIGLFGCSNSSKTDKSANSTLQTSTSTSTGSENQLPLKEPVTLTYWTILPSQDVRAGAKSWNDTPLYQELQKKTNIQLNFIHPPAGQVNETFSLMIASNQYPDIIENYFGLVYKGGLVGAMNDKIIIPLNDLMDQYMPNFKKAVADFPQINKEAKSTDGKFMVLPMVRDITAVNTGPVIRKELLGKTGLAAPQTIDEWYTLLKAFKDKNLVKWPIYLGGSYNGGYNTVTLPQYSEFLSAWGIGYSYYTDNGKVKFGPIDPKFKEFLSVMNKWYNEGLMYPDFPTIQTVTNYEDRIYANDWGSFTANIGSLEKYITQNKKNDPNYDLMPAPTPVLKKGDTNRFLAAMPTVVTDNGLCISTQNKHLKETALLLDYGYSKEGSMLYSLGMEGESYTINNGKTTLTDKMFHNDKNLAMTDMLSIYSKLNNGGAFIQDKRFYEAYWYLPEQNDGLKLWANGSDAYNQNFPYLKGVLTADESSKMASKKTQIDTYVNEMTVKFITGKEPLDNFNKFVDTINSMGLSDCITAYQAANDRYWSQK